MKYFKIKANRVSKRYKITSENFLEITERKFPFEQINSSGKISQYGICPSCLNSIQLIGLVKEIKRQPYGKHTGKDIKGLPAWNQQKYIYCPFAAKNMRANPNDDELLSVIDDRVIELYDLLKNQFDRVIYVLGKELGIKCSMAFWKKVLNQYIVNEVYLYPWLTEANLPYIFAYFGMQHQRVYKQQFLIGSDIYKALDFYTGVDFVKVNDNYALLSNKKGKFLNLFFRFVDHSHKVSDGETLIESMLFCIDDRTTGKTVYQKRIEFKETYFMNIVNKADNVNKRNKYYLEIANEVMHNLTKTK